MCPPPAPGKEPESPQASGIDDEFLEAPEPSPSTLTSLLEQLAHEVPATALQDAFASAVPSDGERDDGGAEAEEDEEWFDLDISDFSGPRQLADARLALRRVRERLKAQLTPKRILLRDKLAFVLGTLDLFVSAFWLGRSPGTFYQLYSVKAVAMLATRWVLYRLSRQHYYLLDVCYFGNALLLLHVWAFPASVALAKVVFAFSFGPLLWSILAFRNSLVYHSIDKLTSLFMHLFPAMVSLCLRWHPHPAMAAALEADPAVKARWERASPWELCFLPMGPYLAWAALYYIKIFHVSSAKIAERGYETLYSYVTSRRGIFSTVVLRFPRRAQPLAYICFHMSLTLAVMLFNTLWWSHRLAGGAFVMAAFALSALNGASFYFDVFAHRYLAGLGLEPRRNGGKSREASAAPSPAAVAAAAPAAPHAKDL